MYTNDRIWAIVEILQIHLCLDITDKGSCFTSFGGHRACVCVWGGSAVLGTGQARVGRDGVQRSTCEPSEQQPENI